MPHVSPVRRFLPVLVCTISLWFLGAGSARADATEPGDLENELRPAEECKTCHLFANPPEQSSEPMFAPYTWQGSMMANAARDPVFWAGVNVASADHPEETVVCIRCHAPRAFLDGRGDATKAADLEPQDFDGVTCDLCHRMIDDGVTPPGNARYVIDDELAGGTEVARRGPWTYTEEDGMRHAWSDDVGIIAESRSCGTCHDVTTPTERVDDSGLPMGRQFNEQRTYSEWLGSAFAIPGDEFRSCQDCHMPAVADVAGCLEFLERGDTHATGGRLHDLSGANRPMIELLKAEYGTSAGGSISDVLFNQALAQTDAILATAATLDVEFPSAVDLQQGIASIAATVTNNTGHKLPTGYSEGRVMWLEVTGMYGDELVYSSGYWDGMSIEEDAQVRRYEAVAEDFADGETFHLLRNNHWVVDNRIPPKGLGVDVETDPVGDRYELLGDNTWPHRDQTSYTFGPATVVDAGPDVAPEMRLTVRLRYLINTPEYLKFLEEQGGESGTILTGLLDEHGRPEPLVVAEQSVAVPLSGLSEGDDDDDDDDDDTSDDDDDTGDDDDDVPDDDDDVPDDDDDAPDDDDDVPDDDDDVPGSGESSGDSSSTGPTAIPISNDGCGCTSPGRGGGAWMIPLWFAFVPRRKPAPIVRR